MNRRVDLVQFYSNGSVLIGRTKGGGEVYKPSLNNWYRISRSVRRSFWFRKYNPSYVYYPHFDIATIAMYMRKSKKELALKFLEIALYVAAWTYIVVAWMTN